MSLGAFFYGCIVVSIIPSASRLSASRHMQLSRGHHRQQKLTRIRLPIAAMHAVSLCLTFRDSQLSGPVEVCSASAAVGLFYDSPPFNFKQNYRTGRIEAVGVHSKGQVSLVSFD